MNIIAFLIFFIGTIFNIVHASVDTDDTYLQAMYNAAQRYEHQGDIQQAKTLYTDLFEKTKNTDKKHSHFSCSQALALILFRRENNLLEAKQMFQYALSGFQQLQQSSEAVLTTQSHLAFVLKKMNTTASVEEALYLLESVLEEYETLKGSTHPSTLASVTNLGLLLSESGRYDEAEVLLKRAASDFQDTLGISHTRTIAAHVNLASFYEKKQIQKLQLSIEQYELALSGTRYNKKMQDGLIFLLTNLGLLLKDVGNVDFDSENLQRAETCLREVYMYELAKETNNNKDNKNLFVAAANLASVLISMGKEYEEEAQELMLFATGGLSTEEYTLHTLDSVKNVIKQYTLDLKEKEQSMNDKNANTCMKEDL